MLQGVRHIKAFVAVARLGSFTRAAAEVNVSQPALTVQIRQLEESLGVRLFDRNKRQVVLTQAGRDLLPALQRVLSELEAVMDAGHDLAGLRRGSVSVATLPSVAAGLLPLAIRRFAADHPNIDVKVSDVVAERIIQLVKAEEVDFGIGSRVGPDRDVEVIDFLSDRMCAFFPVDHPLAGRRPLLLKEVAAFPLILTARGTSVRSLLERVLEKEGLEIGLACEANYMSTAVGMVRAGLGISVLPESAVDSANCDGIAVEPIRTPGLVRRIGFIRKANRSLSPAAERFTQLLTEVAGLNPPHFSSLPPRP
ncbi:LysR family transcriptional regulator [Azospirillum thiophilum]|uniref:LysR family transcriptional regulator n=1 Tax=Azospirillum thiophilum TaxID=528244 RepID=A0AAC8W579_9PROT|nr:LysR family transcriptional regulator [Azospirillum thiophilum]ALG75252.1 LysR family transcriptional regulator [Azospirillum thiophilum]KJR62645.1 LysR family transcriptional regulator [Azospirillum thiophilum]